ncbi:MAG: protein-L-isoaspartate(D-aspartate) O-methyltransferase [Alphaproteobacteria bacterium]
MRQRLLFSLLVLALAGGAHATSDDDYAAKRRQMVREIAADAIETSGWIGKTAFDERVMEAIGRVPRHEFVPPEIRRYAYLNRPLPIGYGQTISQPYIVALMTDMVTVDEDDVVLEIGTGAGYQASILAELVTEVYTVEIIEELALEARERLDRLGYANIRTRVGDGYYGWKEHAPFDAIVVTAAPNHIPPSLINQLKPGGRMAIPVGSPFADQFLMLVEKDGNGRVRTRQVLPVVFSPFAGGERI